MTSATNDQSGTNCADARIRATRRASASEPKASATTAAIDGTSPDVSARIVTSSRATPHHRLDAADAPAVIRSGLLRAHDPHREELRAAPVGVAEGTPAPVDLVP